MDNKIENATLDQMLSEFRNAPADTFATESATKSSNQKPAIENQVTHFIDSDDVEEIKSEPCLSPPPEPNSILENPNILNIDDAKSSNQCTINMDVIASHDKSLDPCSYDSFGKTLYTAEDHQKEQFSKIYNLPDSRFVTHYQLFYCSLTFYFNIGYV